MIEIELCDGKYKVLYGGDEGGTEPYMFKALRHGDEWRDLIGDGLVLSMVQLIDEQRQEIARLKDAVTAARQDGYGRDEERGDLERKLNTAIVQRDHADQRAGAAERKCEGLQESVSATAQWTDEAKAAAGYGSNVSFLDVVWKDLLEQRAQFKSDLEDSTGVMETMVKDAKAVGEYPGFVLQACQSQVEQNRVVLAGLPGARLLEQVGIAAHMPLQNLISVVDKCLNESGGPVLVKIYGQTKEVGVA